MLEEVWAWVLEIARLPMTPFSALDLGCGTEAAAFCAPEQEHTKQQMTPAALNCCGCRFAEGLSGRTAQQKRMRYSRGVQCLISRKVRMK